MKFTEVKNSTSTDKKCGSSETICQSPVISEENGTTCMDGVLLTKPGIALDEIPDEMYDGTNFNEQDMVEYYRSEQLTKCCNVEDVAELIGEISLGLNGLTSSVLFDCPVTFEQCLDKCLSPSDKLSWLKKLLILDNRAREVYWAEDQECADEEAPICPLISITKCLLGHVGNHLGTSKLDPFNHFQVEPVADDSIELSEQCIKFVTRHFSLTLLKRENSTKCHNCDVAFVLLYILSRYIQENTSIEQVPGHDFRESKVQSILKENEEVITLENSDSSRKCCPSIATFRPNEDIKSNVLSVVKRLSSEHLINSAGFPDQESIYSNSAFEEECLIHSALLPLKEDENSSESRSGTCETMPPSTLYFGAEEEMNAIKVTYGTMDKVLEFLKRDVIVWKNSSNRDRTAGVVLNKYKQIIKIKNGNYNEGVHYIKGTSSPLGSGCSGKCYLARDIYTRQVFCLKIVQSFKNSEIEVWAALGDVKGTPKFYGILFHTDYVYILQEFIHGPTVDQLIKQNEFGMNLRSSLTILKGLLITLSELHERGVVHNDVKADNIILGKRQVLLDFGLSVKSTDGVKKGVTPCGSQCHWSPEKAASEEYGAKSDVWAAIVVFIHMISGSLPWLKRFNGSKALHYIIKTKSPPFQDVPNNLHSDVFDLIRKGWDVNADSRADANELLNHKAFNLIENYIEETKKSLELINRSGDKNAEDIMKFQLQRGQKLLEELPKDLNLNSVLKIRGLNAKHDPDSNSRHPKDEALIIDEDDILNILASAPNLYLSKEVSEEVRSFFESEKNKGNGCTVEDNLILKLSEDSNSLDSDLKKNRTLSKIPKIVEELTLSSDESEDDAVKKDSNLTSEGLVRVSLEDGTLIYSCNLNSGSNTCWYDIAKRCSSEVHNRNIPSFYLILYPSGEKINANENVMETLRSKMHSNGPMPITQECKGTSENLPHSKIIQAKVVNIINDLQSWEWKVENNQFFSYKWWHDLN